MLKYFLNIDGQKISYIKLSLIFQFLNFKCNGKFYIVEKTKLYQKRITYGYISEEQKEITLIKYANSQRENTAFI